MKSRSYIIYLQYIQIKPSTDQRTSEQATSFNLTTIFLLRNYTRQSTNKNKSKQYNHKQISAVLIRITSSANLPLLRQQILNRHTIGKLQLHIKFITPPNYAQTKTESSHLTEYKFAKQTNSKQITNLPAIEY